MSSDKPSKPDDRDLMRLLDGELEGERPELDDEAKAKLASLEAIGSFLRETADADARADGIADAVMAEIAKEAKVAKPEKRHDKLVHLRQRPANDNSRSILTVAAFAAAAAAALFVWGRTQPGDLDAARVPVAESPVAEMPARIVNTAAPAPVASAAPTSSDKGVEVASVDFGNQHGTVMYTDDDEAVVWIHEGHDGEKE